MASTPEEWIKQAEYDLETAECLLKNDRNFYAVFTCHLALEKALKGIYHKRLNEMPPKTHNLIFLLEKASLGPSRQQLDFLVRLNETQMATRYPEDMDMLEKEYTSDVAQAFLSRGKEILTWIKAQF